MSIGVSEEREGVDEPLLSSGIEGFSFGFDFVPDLTINLFWQKGTERLQARGELLKDLSGYRYQMFVANLAIRG